MLGTILGDIIGSRFEFANILTKEFDLFHPRCDFTDDTVMTCAVAEAVLTWNGDPAALSAAAADSMHRIGIRYPDCGYGARFIGWIHDPDAGPYGSYGNGAAMRVSPVGFAARSEEEAVRMAQAVTRVSHDHPEGIRGAAATAVAVYLARIGAARETIMDRMAGYYPEIRSVTWYREHWQGHGPETCPVTVPQALACFGEGESFEDVMRNCISIGGDSDTIAAIAGGIAEAFFGIPEEIKEEGLAYLPEDLRAVVDRFYACYPAPVR